MKPDNLIASVIGLGLGFMFSIQPMPECKPVEIIKWFEPEVVYVQPSFGRPESDWLQQYEREETTPDVADRAGSNSQEEVEGPRRHRRWRHKRRAY